MSVNHLADRDARDLVSGALLLVGGMLFSIYGLQNYTLGSLRQLGPGMFPVSLGALQAIFGVLLLLQAWTRPRSDVDVRFWSPLLVLAAISGFAITVRPFGVVPAITICTFVSSLADLKFRPLSMSILSGGLSLAAWLIFQVGLKLPIQMFRWPF